MSGILIEEELSFLSLAAMFEKIDPQKVLEVLRANQFDIERSIDELLTVPESLVASPSPVNNPLLSSGSLPQDPPSTDPSLPSDSSPLTQSSAPSSSDASDSASELVISDLYPNDVDQEIKSFELVDGDLTSGTLNTVTASPLELLSKEDRRASKMKKLESKIKHHDMKKQLKQDRLSAKKTRLTRHTEFAHFPSSSRGLESHQSPILSITTSPIISIIDTPDLLSLSSSVGPDRETQLLQRIAELEAANARLEDEKKSRMRFMMGQLDDLKDRLNERDQKIDRIELELEQLHAVLCESKQHENRLQHLLHHSRDVLMDGIQSLSKNVGQVTEKGWAKVQYEASGLFSGSDEKEFKIIQTMRELAINIRDEIKEAFHPKRVNVQTQPISESDQDAVVDAVDMEREMLSVEEADEDLRAKMASLETYAQEQRGH